MKNLKPTKHAKRRTLRAIHHAERREAQLSIKNEQCAMGNS